MRTLPTPPSLPFVGYRVSLVGEAAQLVPTAGALTAPAFPALAGGQRAVTVSVAQAAALYDAAELAARAQGVPIPLSFVPIRCRHGRALPFARVALSAVEILYLVHEGFFGPDRGRQAAIRAVEACGALPVPGLALPPLGRLVSAVSAERHVDVLIEVSPSCTPGQAALSEVGVGSGGPYQGTGGQPTLLAAVP